MIKIAHYSSNVICITSSKVNIAIIKFLIAHSYIYDIIPEILCSAKLAGVNTIFYLKGVQIKSLFSLRIFTNLYCDMVIFHVFVYEYKANLELFCKVIIDLFALPAEN